MKLNGLLTLAAAVTVALLSTSAEGGLIDLRLSGSSNAPGTTAAIGGTFYLYQSAPQTAGTGVIDPFLSIQQQGSADNEQGYSTDIGEPFDAKRTGGGFTRAIHVSDIPVVNLFGDGVLYREFLLDVHEPGSAAAALLAINQLQIFLSNTDPNLDLTFANTIGTNTPPVKSFSGTTEIFRMNNAVTDFSKILLDGNLTSGSGQADMFFYVPDSIFQFAGNSNPFVVFYTQSGVPPTLQSDPFDGETSAATFEEWAVREGGGPPIRDPLTPVPEPATAVLWGLGLAAFGLVSRRRLQRSAD